MSSTAGPIYEPPVGEDVTILVHTDDRPLWAKGKIVSAAPFSVEIDAAHADLLRSVPSLLVLHDSGRKYCKGEGKVGNFVEKDGKAWLKFTDFRWEIVDNRDNPRFEVSIQAVVRSVQEHEGKVVTDDQVGVLKNLSLGGALVELRAQMAKGQLVEFRATIEPNVTIRAMGVIAHTSPTDGLAGISFVDYIGAARYTLHQYLKNLAA